jgi:hypothetical protein
MEPPTLSIPLHAPPSTVLTIRQDSVTWIGGRGGQERIVPLSRIVGADAPPSLSSPFLLRIAELYDPRSRRTRPRFLARAHPSSSEHVIERRLRIHTFRCACPREDVLRAVMAVRLLTLRSERRRVHVLINPHSGKGAGDAIFERRIAPIFDFAGLRYDVTRTSHAGHAIEVGRAFEPLRFEGVVVVGGDGTVQEFVTGLLTRPDWRTLVRRVPICSVACGTANALAVGLRTTCPEYAAQLVIMHRLRPLDAILVSNGAGLRTVALCGVGWGIAADIAVQSERTRWLGTARYDFLKALFGLRIFFGLTVHRAHLEFSGDVAMDDVALAAYFAQPVDDDEADGGGGGDGAGPGAGGTAAAGVERGGSRSSSAALLARAAHPSAPLHIHGQRSILAAPQPGAVWPSHGRGAGSLIGGTLPAGRRVARLRLSRSALEMYTAADPDEVAAAAQAAAAQATAAAPPALPGSRRAGLEALAEAGGAGVATGAVSAGIGSILGRNSLDLDAAGLMSGITNVSVPTAQITMLVAAAPGASSVAAIPAAAPSAEGPVHGNPASPSSASPSFSSSAPAAGAADSAIEAARASQAAALAAVSAADAPPETAARLLHETMAAVAEQERKVDEAIVHIHDDDEGGTAGGQASGEATGPEGGSGGGGAGGSGGGGGGGGIIGAIGSSAALPGFPPPHHPSQAGPASLDRAGGFGRLTACHRACTVCRTQGRLRYIGHWREAVVLTGLAPRTPPAAVRARLAAVAEAEAAARPPPPPPGPVRLERDHRPDAPRPRPRPHPLSLPRRLRDGGGGVVPRPLSPAFPPSPPAGEREHEPLSPSERPANHLLHGLREEGRTYSTEGSWSTPASASASASAPAPAPRRSISLRGPRPASSSRSPSSGPPTALVRPRSARGPGPRAGSRASPEAVSLSSAAAAGTDVGRLRSPLLPNSASGEEEEEPLDARPVAHEPDLASAFRRGIRRLSAAVGLAKRGRYAAPAGPEPAHVWESVLVHPGDDGPAPASFAPVLVAPPEEAAATDRQPDDHVPRLSVTNRGFEKRRERGEYVTVAAITSGRDAAFVHPSDGFLDLVIARRGGILPTMGLLLRYVGRPCGISDERDSPLYDYVKARSVVLTPEPEGGDGTAAAARLSGSSCLNVDGEVLPGPGPFRIHLMPSLLTAYGEY